MKITKLLPKQDSLAYLFGEIEKDLENGVQVLLLVPAQFTLRAEEEAISRLHKQGFFNLQIMSTNKLQVEILKKQGAMVGEEIDSCGRIMVLRHLAASFGPKLNVFSKVYTKRDFLKLSGDFLLQLKQNNQTVESVTEAKKALGEDSAVSNKLSDMLEITAQYHKAVEGKFYDPEDRLAYVTSVLGENALIQNSKIYYYGFYSFTPREVDFLVAQAKASLGVNILLTLNQDREDILGVYQAPCRAIKRIKTACEKQGIAFEEEAVEICPLKPVAEKHLVRCASPYAQADYVAAQIYKLITEKGLAPSEIAVLCGDPEGQSAVLKRSLESRGIGVFWDSKRSVIHQKAAIGICALLDITFRGMQPSNVSELVSNLPLACGELTTNSRDEFVKYIENFRIHGSAYEKPFTYGKAKIEFEIFKDLEKSRQKLSDTLALYLRQEKAAKTAKEKIALLCNFLEKTIKLPDYLQNKAIEFANKGLMDAAEEYSQIYECIDEILAQAQQLLGGEEISSKELSELIRDSFSELKISLLPQSEGKILLGNLGRSQARGFKAVFVCGFNDGFAPAENNGPAIFTEAETKYLADNNLSLSKNSQMLQQENLYAICDSLGAAEQYLYVIYCESDVQAKTLSPSRLIGQVEELAEFTAKGAEKDEVEPKDLLWGKESALKAISQALSQRQKREIPNIDPNFAAAYRYLKHTSPLGVNSIDQGLSYINNPKPLSAAAFDRLYGSEVSVRTTGLETYAKCPFMYFVSQGLRPAEDPRLNLQYNEKGSLLHAVLEEFVKEMNTKGAPAKEGSLWQTADAEEIEAIAKAVFERVLKAEMEKDSKLADNAENAYIVSRMEQTAVFACKQLVIQTLKGTINRMDLEIPVLWEITAGAPGESVTMATKKLYIKGKIDRVDYSEIGDQTYVKIVDYKSGSTEYSQGDVDKGLALQLFLYLDSAIRAYDKTGESANPAKPIGVFYYKLKDFTNKIESFSQFASEKLPAEIAEQAERFFMLDGPYVNGDEETSLMDKAFASTKETTVFSAGSRSKKGHTPEEFEKIRNTLRANLQDICSKLLNGYIDIKPDKSASPCEYCKYAGICQREH